LRYAAPKAQPHRWDNSVRGGGDEDRANLVAWHGKSASVLRLQVRSGPASAGPAALPTTWLASRWLRLEVRTNAATSRSWGRAKPRTAITATARAKTTRPLPLLSPGGA